MPVLDIVRNQKIKVVTHSRLIDYMVRRPTHFINRMALNNHVVNLSSTSLKKFKRIGVTVEKGWKTKSYPLLPKSKIRLVRWLNDFFYTLFLRFNIGSSDIIWAYEPFNIEKYRTLKRKLLIYEICDDTAEYFREDPTKYKAVLKNEEIICKEADIVFTISNYLKTRKQHLCKNIHVIRNGADFDHFNQTVTLQKNSMDELYYYKRPIIGYHGAVSPYTDFDLLKSLVRAFPEAQFVLIGRINEQVKKQVDDLLNEPNIFFLGERNYKSLPHYLKYFDVTIIPFTMDQLILSVNPIKLYEYLAAGKVVVSTPLPEVIQYAEEGIVEIGNTPGDFLSKLRKAITLADIPEMVSKRIELALSNSLDARFNEMQGIIVNYLISTDEKSIDH